MSQLPFDREAERAVVGSAIMHRRYHHQARSIVAAGDFWLPQHARIFTALDELDDIDTTTTEPWQNLVDLCPYTVPIQSTLRAAAVATITDLPIVAVRALVLLCGDVPSNAAKVRHYAQRRAAIIEAQARVDELVGAAW